MCLIGIAVNYHKDYPLVVIANRDEFLKRETAPLHWWHDQKKLVGGRDLQAMGTWMAMHQSGKFASITNYRDLTNIDDSRMSRGHLPVDYLRGRESAESYLQSVDISQTEYNGYNLLLGGLDGIFHYSNYEGKINKLTDGIHGLSNSLLNTPWPKVEWIKEGLKERLKNENPQPSDFLDILGDTSQPEESLLPDTGVGKDMEKVLSAPCIRFENYGTCCSTIVMIDREKNVRYYEKTYPVGGRLETVVDIKFKIDG